MESITDRYARLAAQVEYPEAWRPLAGETLLGEALRWEPDVEVTLRDGTTRTCDVLVLRTPEGRERSIWTWHAVLKDELIGKVKPGDFLAVHYKGKRQRQSGDGEYDGYRVAIDSPARPSENGDTDHKEAATVAQHASDADLAPSPTDDDIPF